MQRRVLISLFLASIVLAPVRVFPQKMLRRLNLSFCKLLRAACR